MEFDFTAYAAFLLVLCRLTAFMVVAPFFSFRQAPVLVKIGLGLLLAYLIFPFVSFETLEVTRGTAAGFLYLLLVIKETLVGLALGFVASLIFQAVVTAGQLMDLESGFAFANLLDPQTGTETTLLGEYLNVLALLLFLELNGHHQLLQALLQSFALIPLGTAAFTEPLVASVVRIFGGVFALAFRIAAPLIIVLLVSDVTLALLARTVPQLNVFILGFPLKAGLGILVLSLVLPFLGVVLGEAFDRIPKDLALVMKALSSP